MRSSEAISGRDQGLAHTRFGEGMTSVVHNHEFAVWPSLGQFPCGDERSTKIKATMDHDPGDTSQGAGFP